MKKKLIKIDQKLDFLIAKVDTLYDILNAIGTIKLPDDIIKLIKEDDCLFDPTKHVQFGESNSEFEN